LRLNQRLEPEFYLDVIAITGSYDKPFVNGNGHIIEWAVKILQFDHLLSKDVIKKKHIISVAEKITSFHHSLTRSNVESHYGNANSIYAHIHDNYMQTKRLTHQNDIIRSLNYIEDWHKEQFHDLKDLLDNRKKNGFIRDCHGDLHLGNIAIHKNKIILFDCIEFSNNLRQIDLIDEISFLVMDLEANNHTELANHFINHWLQICGDFEGLKLLNFYKVYRAMIRIKVGIINIEQKHNNITDIRHVNRYLELATHYTEHSKCAIIITHGLSGSGKSTISKSISCHINAIHIRSDIERKRLTIEKKEDLYNDKTITEIYNKLETASEAILTASYNALIDATFLDINRRNNFISLASRLNVPCIILDFFAPTTHLEKWIIERKQEGKDASDANIHVLHQQIETRNPLTDYEKKMAITIDTSREINIKSLAKSINEKINALWNLR